MKNKMLIVLFLTISFTTISQEKKNVLQAIQTTIQNYYDGYIYRDIDKLNKAFDTKNGTMKVPITKDDKVVGFKNAYFKDLMSIWGNQKKLSKEVLQNCALTILNIDIVDDKIASAKISMKVDKITYIDILSLQKNGIGWKITNKNYLTNP